MNLYLVSRTDSGDLDSFDSFVCSAKTKEDARNTDPYGKKIIWDNNADRCWQIWVSSPEHVKVELIGTCIDNIARVFCASFNAG